MAEKHEYENEKAYVDEKVASGDNLELNEEDEIENSKIEAVRLGRCYSHMSILSCCARILISSS